MFGDAKLMEHASHSWPNGVVMGVKRCRVLCASGLSLALGGSEKWFDGFFSENNQCG